MSNKKQPYIVKTSSADAGTGSSVPPRYQPPPLPPTNNNNSNNPASGILKHPPQAAKDVKQYAPKVSDNVNVKIPYPGEPIKYYPAAASPGNKPYPYPYPVGAPQSRPPTRPAEEEIRTTHVQVHQDLNSRGPTARPLLDEPGIPQVHPDFRLPPQHRQPLRYPEEEFLRADMLKFVRKPEDNNNPRIITDQNRHMQNIVAELRSLKEANQRLADDNQELRDLCCFLDDDRQKGRKLAREWQRFGRYTASVMRQEVSAYQSKLRELDNKQQELIKDNLELKELCLYLDEERGNSSLCPSCGSAAVSNLRDDGDGSSSSTNADEPAVPQQFSNNNNPPRRTASRERLLHENLARQRSTFNDQIMQYVRSLEQRVKQLEDDKRALTHKINQIAATTGDPTIAIPPDTGTGVLSGRPEAVVRALQVLEVREQLEREGRMPDRGENMSDTTSGDMDDGEKALVREMCNVVWRKLEEGPPPLRR